MANSNLLYKKYAKILKAKRNRKSRRGDPLDIVMSKIIDASDLLEEVNKKIKNRARVQEARKQFFITAVTSIEVLLREYFIKLLNLDTVSRRFTEQLSKKDYNIEDMEFIHLHNISKSELIADNYNFQNISEINKAFSTALSLDFFKDLKNYEWWFDKNDKKKGFFKLGEFYQDLDWLITSRHDFVHDINYEVKISKKAVEDIDIFCITFLSQLGFYMGEKINQLKLGKVKS